MLGIRSAPDIFLVGEQEFTAKNLKATEGDENVGEDSFVLFVSFVVKLIFVCGQ
jgi:hypothetical protein